ncbi:thioredoxin family protein [bacterium]|nr:thioredoxin family protein [bacterium]MBU1994909.1 thioredoxin family protein [bacterium]
MKQILLLLLFTFSLFGAKIDEYAEQMHFSRDYNSSLEQAKKANKPLMLVLVADYCPWCRKLERNTLGASEVQQKLSEVVTVIMDQKYDTDKFPQKYLTPRNPTIFFINPNTDEKFYENIGYLKKKDFLEVLEMMQKEFKK